jgi:outer membrane immunogenic protein
MRELAVAVCLLVALTSSAFAADIEVAPRPVYASAPLPAQYNWSGFYVGIDGGYGFGQQPLSAPVTDPYTLSAVGTLGGINLNGYDVGGHAGYNFHAESGSVVLKSI